MHDDKRNRPPADAPMMRAGYAVTGAAYRPQAWRRRTRSEAGVRSFTDRQAAGWMILSGMDDDRGHSRTGDAVDQAIGFLHPVAGPVAGDVDGRVTDLDGQMRDGGIEVEQPGHVGLRVGRDAVQAVPDHDELPGAGGVIPVHGSSHPL